MDLRASPSDEAFRAELRAWLDATLATLPPEPARDDWPARVAYDTDWQKRLFDAGYAGMSWPKEYGGRDAPPSEQLIFLEECSNAKAPYVGVNFVGTLHAGPTLIAEGTDAQKSHHLRGILTGGLSAEPWARDIDGVDVIDPDLTLKGLAILHAEVAGGEPFGRRA